MVLVYTDGSHSRSLRAGGGSPAGWAFCILGYEPLFYENVYTIEKFKAKSRSPRMAVREWVHAFELEGESIFAMNGSDVCDSNNAAELLGPINALQLIPKENPVTVYSDSSFLCERLVNSTYVKREGDRYRIERKGGNSNKLKLEPVHLWQRLLGLVEGRDVTFEQIVPSKLPRIDRARRIHRFCHNASRNAMHILAAELGLQIAVDGDGMLC